MRINLVVPLAQKATAMRTTETTGSCLERSGAVTLVIGASLRPGDVDSTNTRSTRPIPTMPTARTSRTATRTTTTRTTSWRPWLSADQSDEEIPSVLMELLVRAYIDCRRNKRNRASALAFEANAARNLFDLHERLLDGSYRPGRSVCFAIVRPKPREVWAAAFPDRIVHHLLYNHIAPRFHASFIADSCACIPGRGTLYAAERLESKIRSVTQNWAHEAFYLKCDVSNFFGSINKTILRAQLQARIHEPWWMALADVVLLHDPRRDVEIHGARELLKLIPPHKSLFNQASNVGLPIGNLSSQFFANVYMNAADQYAKHQLRAERYIRYVDDILILHSSRDFLAAALGKLETFLPARLDIRLNPTKTIIQPVSRGVDFVGQMIKPWCRTTRKRTVRAAIHRINSIPVGDVHASANSLFGLMRQATHSHEDRADLANALRTRGFSVNKSLTKTYRRSA